MANKSKWWFEKYDISKDSYKSYKNSSGNSWWSSSYKNATKGWMDKLGGFGWFSDFEFSNKEDKKRRVYRKILNQLQTSINVISGDKELKVRWSDGTEQNTPDSQTVYVSPDNLIDSSNNVTEDVLDVLTGKVYLANILNKQVKQEDYNSAKLLRNRSGGKASYLPTVRLWEALETNIAKKFIEDNWCGFMPHIVKHGEHVYSHKQDIQSFIDETSIKPNVQSVVAGISWNLVNPDNPVSIPSVYEGCVDAASEILENVDTEKNRFNSCLAIINIIEAMLESQEVSSKDSSENEQQEDKENKQSKEDKCDSKNDTPPPSAKVKARRRFEALKLTDSELFGGEVQNNVDSSISNIKTDRDETSDGSLVEMEDVDLQSLKNEFIIPENNSGYDREYSELLFELKSCINSIKNNFYFINNMTFLNSYGHIAGDIDENNLHKMFLNDDRLMMKKDILSQKKISVCLLIDESGSMEDKSVEARNTAVMLAEGLKSYFDISIYGHTAELNVKGCTITEYFTPRNKYVQTCMAIEPKCENVDGLAIELVAKKFATDYPNSRRIIFVLSDGEPVSSYYGGDEAIDHVSKVSDMIRTRMETEIYGIGICDAYGEETGESLYGKNNYVILEDVYSSAGVITRFLKQICNKSTKVLS